MGPEREDYDDHEPHPWWLRVLRPSDYLLILVAALALPLIAVAVWWAVFL
jgi:hypothetical protein